MIVSKDFELVPWQRSAVEAWITGGKTPFHGTLEIFTGGGKSLIALQCAAEAARQRPELRVAIVVPTEALARQWREVVLRHTNVSADEIGLLGAGGQDELSVRRVLIAVLNTAAKRLPDMARFTGPLMLIVDECHRAGAAAFSRVLDTPADFRLGLSATPDREEFGEDGEPLEYDDQVVGRLLGPLVFRFGLKDAREIGWLPDFEVHHHGITLLPAERSKYEAVSRQVTSAADDLRSAGADSSMARQLQRRNDEVGAAARAYVALTSERKDLLYRASDRQRVASRIIEQVITDRSRKVLLFHERVDQAVDLAESLRQTLGTEMVALEHSRLPDRDRLRALAAFRDGSQPVLVSVKSLVEGIDVPDAEVGISVAASASVRQRIQSLGRVLRKRFDQDSLAADAKRAEMHLLYVAKSVDESIYSKEDWGDLTGEAVNHYWLWETDPLLDPVRQDGPPATPRPSEEAEWERLGQTVPAEPVEWNGSLIGQEYSVDTMCNIRNRSGSLISNPQGVDKMVVKVRGRAGGRFRVTPAHQLVLVTAGDGEGRCFVAGQISEPFATQEEQGVVSDAVTDLASLLPGDTYPGPTDKANGTFHIRAKRGGVIERKVSGGSEFASMSTEAKDPRERNASVVLDAWKAINNKGMSFHVNSQDHAWYTQQGLIRFLAAVPGGFAWPTEDVNNDNDIPQSTINDREQGRKVHNQEGIERLGSSPRLPLEFP